MTADEPLGINTQPNENALPPPRFDTQASATAQPVEPIHSAGEPVHKNSFGPWRQQLRSLGSRVGVQSRALALVVVVGLVTGALGGMLLVKAARADSSTQIETPVVSTDLAPADAQKLDEFANQLNAWEVTAATLGKNSPPKVKGQFRPNRPRAYRVAIKR